jgi:hypothetical protein
MPTIATLRQQLRKLTAMCATKREPPILDDLRRDPANLMALAGLPPDPWQAGLLRSPSPRTMLLCSRQAGKSLTAAAMAIQAAVMDGPALILLLSPTLRQSGELFRDKVLTLWRALGCPYRSREPTQLELTLSNGSRIVSLPETESGIRGFSNVRLLIVDEAARVTDELYRAVRPMLAVSRGRLVLLSTPFGQRGFFFEEWQKNPGPWQKVRITADQCPRIAPEFLEDERDALGERWYLQEYFCEFNELAGSVFSFADICAATEGDVEPLTFP